MINQYFEFFSVLIALLTSFLTIKQRAIRWPIDTAIIIINLYVHHKVHLYDRWLLSSFIIINNFYGWYQWLYGGKNRTVLKVSLISMRTLFLLIVIGLFSSLFFSYVLKSINSDYAYLGALRTAFSIIAIWMAAKKKLENWIFWFFLNIIGVFIYYQKGLYFYSFKYLIYMILVIYGYFTWKATYFKSKKIKK